MSLMEKDYQAIKDIDTLVSAAVGLLKQASQIASQNGGKLPSYYDSYPELRQVCEDFFEIPSASDQNGWSSSDCEF